LRHGLGCGRQPALGHGWADYAISPYSTLGYYDRVVNAAGGQALADGFVRCYIAPGVDHTATGRGAPIADLLGAVDAWVDEGIAPGDLIAYRQQGGDLIPFRPLCRHPTYPHYSGGPANAAASFRCQSPDLATDLGT
jgi:feruloyl esterase